MPNPRRRHTRTRRDKRRAGNFTYEAGNYAACPQCTEAKLPHRVCPHCGYYRGVEVITPPEEE